MIDHVWTVVCSRAVIDRESNNVSLQNVLEQVTIATEPMPKTLMPLPFDVVTLWARADPDQPCSGRMRLTLVFPSGGTFEAPLEAEIDLSKVERNRQRFRFPGLPMAESGRHIFRVELIQNDQLDWHQVASVPLTIILKRPEEGQAKIGSEPQSGRSTASPSLG